MNCNISIHSQVFSKVKDVFYSAITSDDLNYLADDIDKVLSISVQWLVDDILAYSERDPASHGRITTILECSTSFHAVICYRLASALSDCQLAEGSKLDLLRYKFSNYGKLISGIEIHPGATIGKRFVIDHGYGTVIGETCCIGDNCYILSNVILGAVGIADNITGKRHPTIGNQVEIGCGARVLGPVTIGDNVFIAPSCVVTDHIPSGTKITIANQLQICRTDTTDNKLSVSAYVQDDTLHLTGTIENLQRVASLDSDHNEIETLALFKVHLMGTYNEYRISKPKDDTATNRSNFNILLCFELQQLILINVNGISKQENNIMNNIVNCKNVVDFA